MSNLICTVICPCENQMTELHDLVIPYQRKYAKRIGADYLIIHNDELGFMKNKKGRHPSYATFNVYKYIGFYDRVMTLDPDMLIKPSAPDIFYHFPDKRTHYCLKQPNSSGGAAAIMILSDNLKNYDLGVLVDDFPKTDEKVQALMFKDTRPKFGNMGYTWNCFYGQNTYVDENDNWRCHPDDAKIIHFHAGLKRLHMRRHPNIPEEKINTDILNNFRVSIAKEMIERYCK